MTDPDRECRGILEALDRLSEVVEPFGIAELRPGNPPVLQGPRREYVEAELVRHCDRRFGGHDAFGRPSAHHLAARHLGEVEREDAAGWMALEQLQRLLGEIALLRSATPVRGVAAELDERLGGAELVADFGEQCRRPSGVLLSL